MRTILRIAVLGAVLLVGGETAVADEEIAGRYVGEVYETDLGNYLVFVEIASDAARGSVEYLNYPCGGELTRLSDDGFGFSFAEKLTFGQAMCFEGRTVRITAQGSSEIYFEEVADGQARVWGTLFRIHAPIP